jgi:deferrochelatase/peroxidase EfeB
VSNRGITRARLLAGAALGGAAALGGGFAIGRARDHEDAPDDVVAFYGEHQAGIATPPQGHLVFAAFDLDPRRRASLEALMRDWTHAAARLTNGEPVGAREAGALAPPGDTGEATGLYPARLTLTFGFGPSLFDEQTGLRGRRPEALVDLPVFNGEALEADRSNGDLCIQACSDDPQVAFHAVRNLTRIARGAASLRWIQQGFLRAANSSDSATPRNLMGFRDGTNNLPTSDSELMRAHVWADAADGSRWMAGGTYLVARRIRIMVEAWDRTSLQEQEQLIGRHKESGAPIGETHEFASVVASRQDPAAHVRVASPDASGRAGERLLRRGFNFTDGIDPSTGQLDAGLFFIAFQRDPRKQFVPLQARLASQDGLNEYLRHTASAIFCCPPGVREGGTIGGTLLLA